MALAEQENVSRKKSLSQTREVNLPLKSFENEPELCSQFVSSVNLTTPITKTLRTNATENNESLNSKTDKNVKYRIFLSRLEDNSNIDTDIQLTIESGSKADSNALLFILSEIYKIQFSAFREIFAIWMVSPIFEVQLKPYHQPYECRAKWKTLLERFNPNSNFNFNVDEPFLMLRRSVNLTSERELELIEKYPKIAQLLIIDAKEMIIYGKIHFSNLNDAIEATAILLCLNFGKYNQNIHNIQFIRNHIEELLPEKLCDSIGGITIFGKNVFTKMQNIEKLIQLWKKESNFKNEAELQIRFIRFLTQVSSCYGSAWFDAIIEKKTSIVSIKNFGQRFANTEVKIGLNDRWITIVDKESDDVLLAQSIDEISWKLDDSEKDSDPILLLNLNPCSSSGPSSANSQSSKENESIKNTAYYLMVFGHQVALIDALLRSLSGKTISRSISDSSSSESSTSSEKHNIIIHKLFRDCSKINDKKLCFAKIENGICTSVAGSLKDVFVYGSPYD